LEPPSRRSKWTVPSGFSIFLFGEHVQFARFQGFSLQLVRLSLDQPYSIRLTIKSLLRTVSTSMQIQSLFFLKADLKHYDYTTIIYRIMHTYLES